MLQIKGKSFNFSFEALREGGFVKIFDMGRKKIHRATLTASMVTWMCASLAPVIGRSSGFEMKKRFGRALAWVKMISNSRGGFIEIDCSLKG